jgi:hypothetical protein
MAETNRENPTPDDGTALTDLPSHEALLWIQAHRAAAQAVVGTALGVRVIGIELQEGPPPVGVVRLGESDAAPADVPDHGLVRLLTYKVAGHIAERIAEQSGPPLQGEAAYLLATLLLAQMRQPDAIDEETDVGAVARLLLDHFGARETDAAEAAEHLAMNVEGWVCEHWGTIAVVAHNLLRYRYLAGAGVRQLIPPMHPGALL